MPADKLKNALTDDDRLRWEKNTRADFRFLSPHPQTGKLKK
jgi:hypothetical protein